MRSPTSRPRTLFTQFLLAELLALVLCLAPARGDLLPATPFKLGEAPNTIDVNKFGADKSTNFTQDVFGNWDGMPMKVGSISFDYNTWYGKTAGGTDTGGGALAGQFAFAAAGMAALKPGFVMGWVQTVVATVSGSNEWEAPDGTWFPDTKSKQTDPDYPFQSLPDGTVPKQPSVAFQDFPNRFFGKDQYWLAELGLVCKNLTTHEAHVVDTFLWGFDVTAATSTIVANPPHFWSAPTTTYLDTLNNYFDGKQHGDFTSTKWTFDANGADCWQCVPEPSSLAIAGLGGVAFLVYCRRVRESSKAAA
jgi:hypothetical protein